MKKFQLLKWTAEVRESELQYRLRIPRYTISGILEFLVKEL